MHFSPKPSHYIGSGGRYIWFGGGTSLYITERKIIYISVRTNRQPSSELYTK